MDIGRIAIRRLPEPAIIIGDFAKGLEAVIAAMDLTGKEVTK
jgi:hypothetical protein